MLRRGFTIIEISIFIFLLSILLAGFIDFSYTVIQKDTLLINEIKDAQ